MEYITPHDTLELLTKDGHVAVRFKNGYYNAGANTTIETQSSEASGLDIQMPWDTDLNGNGAASETDKGSRLERAGQGSLTGYASDDATLTAKEYGYNRTFYPAPTLTSTSDAVTKIAGVKYVVLTGTTIYKGTTYTIGQTFKTSAGTTATTGTGTFRLALPDSITKPTDDFRTEAFAKNQLGKTTDATGYWNAQTGYDGRADEDSTAADYIGSVD